MKNSVGITVESVVLDHTMIIRATGTDADDVWCDEDKLDSAINSVYQTFEGEDLYKTKEEKASRLFFNLNTGHCFGDGNKRIAVYQLLRFLRRNGIEINASDKDLEELAFKTLSDKNYHYVVEWILERKINTID